jgi:hypothetical protein
MNQPFMLLFARNRVPSSDHKFHFVSPYFERRLNEKGRIRIDYQSAQPVASSEIIKTPWLLKTLAVGTSLDVEVLRKLDDLGWPTVKSYWMPPKLYSGLGYNLSPELEQHDASFMFDMPDYIPPVNDAFSVDVFSLPKFKRKKAHKPRCVELYSHPLLIIPQSPGASFVSPKSYVLHKSTVFNQSYYGFSTHGLGDIFPVALLHLLTHSELFRYRVLMTSSRLGAERRTFLKENLENFPFPHNNIITKKQRERALNLSSSLETAADKPWEEINSYIYNLYGLDAYDRQVVKDTLQIAEPFKEARDRADDTPSVGDRKAFYDELQRLIAPSFKITSESVTISEVEIENNEVSSPWYFFAIYSVSTAKSQMLSAQKQLISQITAEANKAGCSRAIVHGDRYLLVGILGQYRYWTLSRARLCALDILRHHLDVFPIGRG